MKNNIKKSIIDTYETIYFVDIVVANKYATLEELQNLYTYSDGEILNNDILSSDCTVSTCRRISDDNDVILVKYNHESHIKSVNKKLDFINTICHEAGHVVLDIYEHMHQNVCNCSSEPFCYLLGYVGECIYKTLTKK